MLSLNYQHHCESTSHYSPHSHFCHYQSTTSMAIMIVTIVVIVLLFIPLAIRICGMGEDCGKAIDAFAASRKQPSTAGTATRFWSSSHVKMLPSLSGICLPEMRSTDSAHFLGPLVEKERRRIDLTNKRQECFVPFLCKMYQNIMRIYQGLQRRHKKHEAMPVQYLGAAYHGWKPTLPTSLRWPGM